MYLLLRWALSRFPIEATTPRIINKLHDLMMDYWWLKVRQIASTLDISNKRVYNVLRGHLNMRVFPQDGCRNFLQLSANENVSLVSKTICSSFIVVHRTLVIVLSIWSGHGYSTTRSKSKNSPNNQLPVTKKKMQDPSGILMSYGR